MYKKLEKSQYGIAHLAIPLVLAVLVVIGAAGWVVYNRSQQSDSKKTPEATVTQTPKLVENTEEVDVPASAAELSQSQSGSSASKPAPTPAPQPVSNNCLPANANQYQKTWSGNNTMGVLSSNGYTSTKKFYDALNFAGLADVVNSPKTVVFAVNDYVWDNDLTQAQKDWLNANPTNMKSMLQWQIVQSCVIWSGQIESATGPVPITTMGGAVTYYPGSPGNISGAKLAMWDFFSSNGSMHLMSDFIKPPVL